MWELCNGGLILNHYEIAKNRPQKLKYVFSAFFKRAKEWQWKFFDPSEKILSSKNIKLGLFRGIMMQTAEFLVNWLATPQHHRLNDLFGLEEVEITLVFFLKRFNDFLGWQQIAFEERTEIIDYILKAWESKSTSSQVMLNQEPSEIVKLIVWETWWIISWKKNWD